MKTLDDALCIRQRLFTAFEIAETLPPGPERDSWLTFAVAGGGPTGVELAGQIREMATRTLAHEFHSIEPEDARVLLFDGGDRVLKSFSPALAHQGHPTLQRLGVELRLGVHVTDVRQEGVTVSPKAGGPDEDYAARTVLWTAGVEAVPFARHIADVLGAPCDRSGRIAVDPDLSVPGHPEMFVIGDLVGRDALPGVAENAMQGGLHVASCIRRELEGKPRKPYRYRDLGSAAYISRGQALLAGWPVRLSGFPGWVAWGLHPHRVPHRGTQSRQHGRDVAGDHRPCQPLPPRLHARRPRGHRRPALHVVDAATTRASRFGHVARSAMRMRTGPCQSASGSTTVPPWVIFHLAGLRQFPGQRARVLHEVAPVVARRRLARHPTDRCCCRDRGGRPEHGSTP